MHNGREYHIEPITLADLTEDERNLLNLGDFLAKHLAETHRLNYRRIIPVYSEDLWGRCNPDGLLEITFFKHIEGANNEKVRWSINTNEVLRTLCHELAHLRILGHQEPFWKFCNQLIAEVNAMTNFRIKPEQNRWGV